MQVIMNLHCHSVWTPIYCSQCNESDSLRLARTLPSLDRYNYQALTLGRARDKLHKELMMQLMKDTYKLKFEFSMSGGWKSAKELSIVVKFPGVECNMVKLLAIYVLGYILWVAYF